MTAQNQWTSRSAMLDDYAGQTVTVVQAVTDDCTPAGTWDIYYGDLAIVGTDGTVVPFFFRQTGSSFPSEWTTGQSNLSAYDEKPIGDPAALSGQYNTTYFHGDQIGSARMLTAGEGWPVSSDTFYPFGQEQTATTDQNHYKFTGKERDQESGLDYFGARYYGSNMGRWMSPDWSAKAEPVPYAKLDNPQSLNLYSYVGNNPLSRFDPDGHYECTGSKSTCKTFDKAVDELRKADAHFKPGTAQRAQLDKVLGVIGDKGKANGLVFTDKANNPNGVSQGAVLGTVTQKGVTTITLDPSAQESRSTEMTALTGHEAQHGVRNAELGRTPNSRPDEKQNEHDAYYMQGLVDEGLGRNSTYGIYSVKSGYNWGLVDQYADESTKIWCANGGNCK